MWTSSLIVVIIENQFMVYIFHWNFILLTIYLCDMVFDKAWILISILHVNSDYEKTKHLYVVPVILLCYAVYPLIGRATRATMSSQSFKVVRLRIFSFSWIFFGSSGWLPRGPFMQRGSSIGWGKPAIRSSLGGMLFPRRLLCLRVTVLSLVSPVAMHGCTVVLLICCFLIFFYCSTTFQ